MAGLDPAIHVFVLPKHFKTWMPVTSTGMTMFGRYLTRSITARPEHRHWVSKAVPALP